MTQIIVTLENDVNPNFIKKIFESIRGVVKTSVHISTIDENLHTSKPSINTGESHKKVFSEEKMRWLENLDTLCNSIDRTAIDLDDEKTRYILSK
ncbi:MAG: hypothetical protein K2N05_02105 [Muribaculaceae bacterium]|nr:hypothetical protein [Muribaculaceae bacterium]